MDGWTPAAWVGTTDASTPDNGALPTQGAANQREGWDFLGWYTQPNGAGNKVDTLATFPAKALESVTDPDSGQTVLQSTTTYYGNWIEKGTAQYSFSTNGGTAVEAWNGYEGNPVEHDALPTTTREGYRFDGWWTSQGTEGTDTGWGVKVTEVPATFQSGQVTFYAKWVALDVTYPLRHQRRNRYQRIHRAAHRQDRRHQREHSVPDPFQDGLHAGRLVHRRGACRHRG